MSESNQETRLLVLSRPNCPMDRPVRAALAAAGAAYDYIDIRADEAARARLREINNGYESVPTLIFPDGAALTEPGPGALEEKLLAGGYELPVGLKRPYLLALLLNPVNWLPLILLLALIIAILLELAG